MHESQAEKGQIGPHFQEPFKEGAHLGTGSTHKTHFGTQRGIVGCPFTEQGVRHELWETLRELPKNNLRILLALLTVFYAVITGT